MPRFSAPPRIIDGVWHFSTKEDMDLFVEFSKAHGATYEAAE